jgi:Domain of unknown function (DUF4123)
MTIWLGWCRLTAGDGDYDVPVAARCNSKAAFDTVVQQWLISQQWVFSGTHDVLPAAEWIQNHPADDGPSLAETVEQGAPLSFGVFVRTGAPLADGLLHVETIDGVMPLGRQTGVWPKLTTPEALRNVLFGQPAPDPGLTRPGAVPSAQALPDLLTYAILDAAKLPLLPDLLEQSGLQFRCLFKGKAYDTLKDAAPYLVQLTEDHAFTRSLFTAAGMPADLWGKDLGIYIRTRQTLDDLWTHFRKFTRLRDTRGKWYFWRFWEPAFFHAARHFVGSHWLSGLEFDSWQHDCIVIYPASEQSLVVTSTGPPRRRPPIHPQSLAVLGLARQHPELAPTLASLPGNHWIVQHLARLQGMSAMPATTIHKLISLPEKSPGQRICAALLGDLFLNPTDVLPAVHHVLKRI